MTHAGAAAQLLLCETQPVAFAYDLAANAASRVTPLTFPSTHIKIESTLSSCDGLLCVSHRLSLTYNTTYLSLTSGTVGQKIENIIKDLASIAVITNLTCGF